MILIFKVVLAYWLFFVWKPDAVPRCHLAQRQQAASDVAGPQQQQPLGGSWRPPDPCSPHALAAHIPHNTGPSANHTDVMQMYAMAC